MESQLKHWGVKGMKWGVRRYQNKDGSLTELGEKRYGRDAREKGYDKEDSTGYYKTSGKKGKREDLKVDADRYVREDRERTRRVVNETEALTNKLKTANERAMRNKQKPKMDLSQMTDKEMRERINRELLERQYNDMFNPQKVNRGREHVNNILDTTGTVLGIVGTSIGIALAVKQLRRGEMPS